MPQLPMGTHVTIHGYLGVQLGFLMRINMVITLVSWGINDINPPTMFKYPLIIVLKIVVILINNNRKRKIDR